MSSSSSTSVSIGPFDFDGRAFDSFVESEDRLEAQVGERGVGDMGDELGAAAQEMDERVAVAAENVALDLWRGLLFGRGFAAVVFHGFAVGVVEIEGVGMQKLDPSANSTFPGELIPRCSYRRRRRSPNRLCNRRSIGALYKEGPGTPAMSGRSAQRCGGTEF